METLHHHDILTEALTRFAREYSGHDRQDILRDLRRTSGATVTTRALGDGGEGPTAPATDALDPKAPPDDQGDDHDS